MDNCAGRHRTQKGLAWEEQHASSPGGGGPRWPLSGCELPCMAIQCAIVPNADVWTRMPVIVGWGGGGVQAGRGPRA